MLFEYFYLVFSLLLFITLSFCFFIDQDDKLGISCALGAILMLFLILTIGI